MEGLRDDEREHNAKTGRVTDRVETFFVRLRADFKLLFLHSFRVPRPFAFRIRSPLTVR